MAVRVRLGEPPGRQAVGANALSRWGSQSVGRDAATRGGDVRERNARVTRQPRGLAPN
jgi:hypothetical protein